MHVHSFEIAAEGLSLEGHVPGGGPPLARVTCHHAMSKIVLCTDVMHKTVAFQGRAAVCEAHAAK